jgi:hypothetical protein
MNERKRYRFLTLTNEPLKKSSHKTNDKLGIKILNYAIGKSIGLKEIL